MSKFKGLLIALATCFFFDINVGQRTFAQTIPFSQIDCWFKDSNFCYWQNQTQKFPKSKWEFKTKNVHNTSVTGPLFAAVGDPFAQAVPYKQSNQTLPSHGIITPPILATNAAACFRFYYYMFGGAYKLTLGLIKDGQTQENIIWSRLYDQGDFWNVKYLTVPPQNTNFRLQFTLYSADGIIALDDFYAKTNSCFSWRPSYLGRFWTFEDKDASQLTLVSDGSYTWSVIQASQSMFKGWNNWDHTTHTSQGHMLETFAGNTGTWASVKGPVYGKGFRNDWCLKFWFWRRVGNDNFEVFYEYPGNSRSLWSSANRLWPKNEWHRVVVPLSFNMSDTNNNFAIKATKSGVDTVLNFDDIQMDPGPCPKRVFCDFNEDTCGWAPDQVQTNYQWMWRGYGHGYGRVANASKLKFKTPPADHGGAPMGRYLYTDFTYQDKPISFARFYSEIIEKTPPSGSCFTFWYITRTLLGADQNSFTLSINSMDNKVISTIWRYNKTADPNLNQPATNQRWVQAKVNVNYQTDRFRLAFNVTSKDPSTYIAIDDVDWSPGTCQSLNQPTTKKPAPTPPPSRSINCNFEQNTYCNWQNSKTNGWQINQPDAQIPDMMPNMDHTGPSSQGRYMYISHFDGQNIPNRVASISVLDNALPAYRGPACLSLWYYMRTRSFETRLNVTFKQGQMPLSTLTRSGDKSEKWHLAKMEYNEDGTNGLINITISALVKYGVVAVDDITVTYASCFDYNNAKQFQCSFEEGRSCGFLIAMPQTPNWLKYTGRDASLKTVDHTLRTLDGHFFGVDFFKDNNAPKKVTEMWTKTVELPAPAKGSACVSFWYLMRGLQNQTLSMGIQKSTDPKPVRRFSVSGEQGPFWYFYRSTVTVNQRWRVAFNISGQGMEGIAAIDDVLIDLTGSCPYKDNWFCDFERGDTCSWEHVQAGFYNVTTDQKLLWSKKPIGADVKNNVVLKTDFTWTVHSPWHGFNQPATDHTTGRKSGNYLLMRNEAPRKSLDRAVLMSPRYSANFNSGLCLRFYYWITKNTTKGSELTIYQSDNYTTSTKIATFNQPTDGKNWAEAKVALKPKNPQAFKSSLWIYIVAMTGAKTGESHIIIDDLIVDSGPCPTTPIKGQFQCNSTYSIPVAKVCDGVRDCKDGRDEKNCGNCDFNLGMSSCNYITDAPVPDDPNAYAWRQGNSTSGPKQGHMGSSGYAVAKRKPGFKSLRNNVTLYTPIIQKCAAGADIIFFVNLNGSRASLKVTLWLENLKRIEGVDLYDSRADPDTKFEQGFYALRVVILKKMVVPFRIGFIATDQSQSSDSYVAIDDVSVYGCAGPAKNITDCGFGGYKCRNGACYRDYNKCDFVDDCDDGTDEQNCDGTYTMCSFESGTCQWGLQKKDNWKLSTGFNTLLDGPTRDHTTGLQSGHFLLFQPKSKFQNYSMITGPAFYPGVKKCQMRFFFSYEGNFTGSFAVVLRNVRNGTTKQVMSYRRPMHDWGFRRSLVDLSYYTTNWTDQFQVMFVAQMVPRDLNQLPYVAIDDISFTPTCVKPDIQPTGIPPPVTVEPRRCPGNRFLCKITQTCISMSLRCNFENNCGPGDTSDEDNCGNCDFNSSMCGWYDRGYGKQQWSRVVASTFDPSRGTYQKIPSRDASNLTTGSFMIVQNRGGNQYIDNCELISPVIGGTGPGCQMRLSYHATKPPNADFPPSLSFYLLILTQWNYYERKWIFTRDKVANNWESMSIPLPMLTNGSQISLVASNGQVIGNNNPYVDIEVDNIQFVNCGPGKQTPSYLNLNCSFEGTYCGWSPYDMSDWGAFRWRLAIPPSGFGRYTPMPDPGYDHTQMQMPRPVKFGGFIYANLTKRMTSRYNATLIADKPQDPGTICLNFWYHLFGVDNVTFEVVVNQVFSNKGGQTIWVKKMPESNSWTNQQLTIKMKDKFYIMFRIRLGKNSLNSVALDDILVSRGACVQSTPKCDFETDTCDWKISGSDWQVTWGQNSKDPPVDHTLGTDLGEYLLAQPGMSQQRVVSRVIDNSIAVVPREEFRFCLRFWAYFKNTVPNQDMLTIKVGQSTYARIVMYSSMQGQWIFRNSSFWAEQNDNLMIYASTTQSNAVVAIDDVSISPGFCEPTAWCDFESDMCGYYNDLTKGTNTVRAISWLRNQGFSYSPTYDGPITDTTTGTVEGWYLYLPMSPRYYGLATLVSQPVTANNTGAIPGQFCVTFNYYVYFQYTSVKSQLNIRIQWNLVKLPMMPIASLPLNNTFHYSWTQFNATFTAPRDFRLVFSTTTGNNSRGFMAIDDIKVYRGVCVANPAITEKPPPPTTPIPIADRQWDCTFDKNNTCSWTVANSNWLVRSYNKSNRMNPGPKLDHSTYGDGKYLLFGQQSSNAIIASAQIPNDQKMRCFSFWYYFDSQAQYQLDVSFQSVSSSYIASLDLMNNMKAERRWKYKQVPMMYYFSDPIKLLITLTPPPNGIIPYGTVALDDFKVTPFKCPARSDHVCQFNSNYNLCGWYINILTRTFPFRWKTFGQVMTAAEAKQAKITSPNVDHSSMTPNGGMFVFGNDWGNGVGKYVTVLHLPYLPPTTYSGSCLKFWYQNSIPTTTNINQSLAVVVQHSDTSLELIQNVVWRTAYPIHTEWTYAQVNILAGYKHAVRLYFSKNHNAQNNNSYIAIDDILLTDGRCEGAVACDFDMDTCGWSQVPMKATWNRYEKVDDLNSWPGPWYDHTRGRTTGSYLYLYRKIGSQPKVGVVKSAPESIKSARCLSMYVAFTGGDPTTSSLLVEASAVGVKMPNQKLTKTMLIARPTYEDLQKSPQSYSIWKNYQVNIDSTLFQNSDEIVFTMTGSLNADNSLVAVDDISLMSGQCYNSGDIGICDDGSSLPIRKICDFDNDCPTNQAVAPDERNCGQCKFDNGLCNWSNNNYTSPSPMWVRVKASDPAVSGPKVDGSNNAQGSYVIFKPIQTVGGQTSTLPAKLVSNRYTYKFKKAQYGCVMTFDYFMSDRNPIKDKPIELGVRLLYSQFSYAQMWRKIGDQGTQWNRGVVSIDDQQGTFMIEFNGYYPNENNRERNLAIDNVNFVNCSSPPAQQTCTKPDQYQCPTKACVNKYAACDDVVDCGRRDFWEESPMNCSIDIKTCEFRGRNYWNDQCQLTMQKTTMKSNWTVVPSSGGYYGQIGNRYRKTGPLVDHSYLEYGMGWYLALFMNDTADAGKKLRFSTRTMQGSNNKYCAVRFFVYMYGDVNQKQKATLNVYAQYGPNTPGQSPGQLLGSRSTTSVQRWERIILPVNNFKPFKFVFEGVIGSANNSDIAIDDISFSKSCQLVGSGPTTGRTWPTGRTRPTWTSRSTRNPSRRTTKKIDQPPQTVKTSNAGAIVAGVLVPIFVIGLAVGGYFYYRKYNTTHLDAMSSRARIFFSKKHEDTINLTCDNPSYQNHEDDLYPTLDEKGKGKGVKEKVDNL